MKKLFATTALAVLLSSAPAFAGTDDILASIDITSTVSVQTAPDIATMSAGVMTSAETAEKAMADNAVKMTALFDALKKAGIADKDIQTSNISINPQYHYPQNGAPVVTGYQATNNVNVVLRKLDNIGGVVDAMVKNGANQMNGPNFSVEDPDRLLDKARADAVRKARQRADVYATAAGVKIDRVINISEQANFQPSPMPMMRAMAMDSAAAKTPTAIGELTLDVTVNVKYEISK